MSNIKDIGKLFDKVAFFNATFDTMSIGLVRAQLIDLATLKFKEGQDAEGNKLKTDSAIEFKGEAYSPFNPKNQKQNFVDLRDTGNFHSSFEADVTATFVSLSAEFEKQEGNIFDNFTFSYSDFATFEEMILGLRENELEEFIFEVFLPYFVDMLIEKISDVISMI